MSSTSNHRSEGEFEIILDDRSVFDHNGKLLSDNEDEAEIFVDNKHEQSFSLSHRTQTLHPNTTNSNSFMSQFGVEYAVQTSFNDEEHLLTTQQDYCTPHGVTAATSVPGLCSATRKFTPVRSGKRHTTSVLSTALRVPGLMASPDLTSNSARKSQSNSAWHTNPDSPDGHASVSETDSFNHWMKRNLERFQEAKERAQAHRSRTSNEYTHNSNNRATARKRKQDLDITGWDTEESGDEAQAQLLHFSKPAEQPGIDAALTQYLNRIHPEDLSDIFAESSHSTLSSSHPHSTQQGVSENGVNSIHPRMGDGAQFRMSEDSYKSLIADVFSETKESGTIPHNINPTRSVASILSFIIDQKDELKKEEKKFDKERKKSNKAIRTSYGCTASGALNKKRKRN